MANRFLLPPNFLQKNFHYLTRRFLNSSSSSAAPITAAVLAGNTTTTTTTPPPTTTTVTPPPILDLVDHKKIFGDIPTRKLLHSCMSLEMAAFEPVVDMGLWVMNSRLVSAEKRNFVREAVLGIVRRTFYEHFCAGEDAKETGDCVRSVHQAGLRSMLVFAVEYALDNGACDRNLEGFLQTVHTAMTLPPSSVSCVVLKITAIFPLHLLERMSDLLRWQQKDPSFNLPWKQNSLPIFSDSTPLYHTLKKPDPLTLEEEHDLELGMQRLMKLCEKCVDANVPLTVDAEHTSVQPAIDYLTYLSAIKYNKDDNPIVFGTMQAYLKDAQERLLLAVKAADKMGVPMGFKIVRGAYMQKERKIASSLGFDSPIHNTIQDTHDCYNNCAGYMLEKIADGDHAVILATHNVESGRLAVTKAMELGIGKMNHKLEFAQLYGMSEALSFGLRNAGFEVSKYMPYGPVDMVIPYLLRRAEENRGMLSASNLDRELMREELKRRIKAAIF